MVQYNRVAVKIQGTSALLMNSPHNLENKEGRKLKTWDKERQAEWVAYRIPKGLPNEGQLYVPAEDVRAALINGGKHVKFKGAMTMKTVVASCVFISPEYLLLGRDTYNIDSRRVVMIVNGKKVAIIRHRPCIPGWALEFVLEYEDGQMTGDQLREIVEITGRRIGLLDYRPEHNGQFGRFVVVKWEDIKA